MAQVFKMNGVTISYIQRGDWTNSPVKEALDGNLARQRWIKHIWLGEAMPVSEFDSLFALEGQRVSITTTDYNDRNGDYLQYFGVQFQKISGEHISILMENVRLEFLVRL